MRLSIFPSYVCMHVYPHAELNCTAVHLPVHSTHTHTHTHTHTYTHTHTHTPVPCSHASSACTHPGNRRLQALAPGTLSNGPPVPHTHTHTHTHTHSIQGLVFRTHITPARTHFMHNTNTPKPTHTSTNPYIHLYPYPQYRAHKRTHKHTHTPLTHPPTRPHTYVYTHRYIYIPRYSIVPNTLSLSLSHTQHTTTTHKISLFLSLQYLDLLQRHDISLVHEHLS
jgi:hypothetical protein